MASSNFQTISTKVTVESFAQLRNICTKYGFTLYDMLQMLCECLIRFMDEKHNLSEDLLRIIRMFERLPGWKNAFRLVEPLDEDVEIVEAFYVVRRRGRDGCRVIHVERPTMEGDQDGWSVSCNIQYEFERFVELTNSSLYMHLRHIAVDLGTESLLDCLHTLANLQYENPDEVELRAQFEDNDWHKGNKVHQDTKYKRTHSHTEEYIERHTATLFEDEEETTNTIQS